jgi:hypothetical protein
MSGNGLGQPKGKEPVERVLDLFVHTPIGLALMAWKRMPELVTAVPDLVGQAVVRGCATLADAEEKLSEEVRKARMIGQVAVTFGGRQLRREVDARLRDARQAAGGVANFIPGAAPPGRSNGAGDGQSAPVTATATPAAPASPPAAEAPVKATPTARKTATKASAAQKPKKAPARQTRKAPPAPAASAADLPIREYDGLSASQVVSRLTGLSPDELRAVRSYEETSRGRRTVILAVDRLLS